MSLKAQSAVEYLMVIAIAMMIIVPTTYFFFSYSSSSASKILSAQLQNAGNLMIGSAAKVYYSGSGSKLTIEIKFPQNLDAVQIIDNRELVFNVTGIGSVSEMVFFSDINITGETCIGNVCWLDELASVGIKKIQFQSYGNQVKITKLS